MVMRLSTISAPFTKVASLYTQSVAKRPLLTNAALGLVIASVGDVCCQHFFEQKEYDAKRTIHMGVIRAVVLAPFLHVYFPFLARLVPGKSFKSAILRVCADQCIGSPVSIALTFAAASVLKGEPMSFFPRVQEQLIPTMKMGAMYWPFVHTLNFRFVPVSHQPIVAHLASLWWNAVLSYRSNTALHASQADNTSERSITVIVSPIVQSETKTSDVAPNASTEPALLTAQQPTVIT